MTSLEIYYNDIWEKTKNLVFEEQNDDSIIFQTFLKDTRLVDLTTEKAIITTKANLSVHILNGDDFKNIISSKMELIIDRSINCSFIFENNYIEEKKNLETAKDSSQSFNDNILESYTFENFVVGEGNKEAHAAALACACSNEDFYYNPLFVYGDSGLGKTHLMHAIGNYLKKKHPEKKILYMPATEIVDKFTSSLKNRGNDYRGINLETFKNQMNSLDYLLIDDIQYLDGKEKTNEFIFSIYNNLVNNRKQIILTSDKPPLELNGIEERLISRFSSGLSVTVSSPEFETKLEILKMKLNSKQKDNSNFYSEEALSYIATNCSGDVRELEGLLNRLMYYSINFGNGVKIDYETAVEALKDVIKTTSINKKSINPTFIINNICTYYGITKQQVMSKSRTKNIVNARHIGMYLCRKHLDIPYKKIATVFGGCDHSTVMSACEKIERLIKENSNYRQAIEDIEKKLS